MPTLHRTDSANPDFISLVRLLDADLAQKDGADHTFYAQFNKIDALKHALVAYEGETPIGCGAMKAFSSTAVEIKRMYSKPDYRGRGIATFILTELERWATALGYQTCVLETGKRQPDAIGLYKKNGYRQTPNYGQYIGIDNSVCFEKALPR